MRLSLLFHVSILLTVAVANLLVKYKIRLNCNESSYHYTGCLREMVCDGNGCVKPAVKAQFDPSSNDPTVILARQSEPFDSSEPTLGASEAGITNEQPVTTDGTCGATIGNTICGDWEKGSCCSLFGFCGNTEAHCGDGCQSGPCADRPLPTQQTPSPAPELANPGKFNVVGEAGVPAMHAGLMPNGRVVFLDKVEAFTQLKLPNGQYAYSAEYDPETNQALGLSYKTNAFCSGGTFLPDGRFISLGGNGPLTDIDPTVEDGFNAIRYLSRASPDENGQGWSEPGNKLASARWYASAQTMPDGNIFVASGSLNGLDPTVEANNNPTYEILDAAGISNGKNIDLDILVNNQPYYMYPFIHLLSDGNLFIFVSKSAQVFSLAGNNVVRSIPDLPGDYRTYPNTGGSVLLPLSSANGWAGDILICGGGAYQDITSPTDPTCGRIQPLADNPQWELDSMPEGRGMVEGTLLPDGTVVWLNGCNQGAQGFGLATSPTLEALIYNPNLPKGQRWSTGAASTIPRLYHSVALLLLDGTIMVAGSNPVEQPILQPVPNQVPSEDFVTEFRVEIYTPPYLQNNPTRPEGIALSTQILRPGVTFSVEFTRLAKAQGIKVALYHGGFVTHSVHMGHRMLFLDVKEVKQDPDGHTEISIEMPLNGNVAPPGPYVLYVVCDGTPGIGQFVKVAR